MQIFLIAAALLPAVFGLTINTPTNVVQCQPILLTFGSGTPPYYVSAIPGGQVSATALRSWDPTSAETITWNVDIASGTAVSFIVKDSTGAQAFSDSITIQPSSDSGCLNGSNSGSTTRISNQVGPATTTVIGSNAAGASQSVAVATAARTTALQGPSSNTVSRTNGGGRQSKRGNVAPLVAALAGFVGVLAL